MMANQPHDPASRPSPASDPRNSAKSRGRGARDDQEPLDGGSDDQWQNDEPQLASAPPGSRSTRGAEPERVSHDGPPQRSLFTPDERHHEHELPDEPGGQRDDQCADQGAWAAQLIGEQRCGHPREQSHRQGGRGPDGDDAAESQLGQGTLVGRWRRPIRTACGRRGGGGDSVCCGFHDLSFGGGGVHGREAMSAAPSARRREVGIGLLPAADLDSYLGRRRHSRACSTFST